MSQESLKIRIYGCLLGTAVGDALGLPYEGLSARRGARLLGEPNRMRLLFGRGMVSDDTEHACLTARALLYAHGDPDKFSCELARRLRLWLVTAPPALGLATLKACLRLWLGCSPHTSGVASAGNGPAMRAPILGAAVDDPLLLRRLVAISTRMTHTDGRAEQGACAAAFAARIAAGHAALAPAQFAEQFAAWHGHADPELEMLLRRAAASADRGETTLEFARGMHWEKGISGYIYQSVPVALHAWWSNPGDFSGAVQAAIRCGGDTDSTAALAGGLCGAEVGRAGIPRAWQAGLLDWPYNLRTLEILADELSACCSGLVHVAKLAASAYSSDKRNVKNACDRPRCATPRLMLRSASLAPPAGCASERRARSNRLVELLRYPIIVCRNILFFVLILVHAARRLLPPY